MLLSLRNPSACIMKAGSVLLSLYTTTSVLSGQWMLNLQKFQVLACAKENQGIINTGVRFLFMKWS